MLENERLLAVAPARADRRCCSACSSPTRSSWACGSRSRSTSVGNPASSSGLKNFVKAWNDSIFRTAFWNTCFYTFWATIFKLALGMWLALLLNRHFRGKRLVRASMLLPFIVPTVLSTFAWRWMFDPTFSVLNWLLYQPGFIVTKLPFLSDGDYGHVVRDRGEHLARHAVLRHHAPGRAADDQPRPPRGGLAGRRQRLEAVLARHLAAAEAGHASWWWSSRSSRRSPTSS